MEIVEDKMANVLEVAKYILEQKGEMTAMKLQKLVYYSQVWSLVWDENELFSDRIEAWSNGAVIPTLYNSHRGKFKVSSFDYRTISSENLTPNQKDTIDRVINFYGNYTAQELSDINHQEVPWKDARGDLKPQDSSQNEITQAAIFEFHSGTHTDDEITF